MLDVDFRDDQFGIGEICGAIIGGEAVGMVGVHMRQHYRVDGRDIDAGEAQIGEQPALHVGHAGAAAGVDDADPASRMDDIAVDGDMRRRWLVHGFEE